MAYLPVVNGEDLGIIRSEDNSPNRSDILPLTLRGRRIKSGRYRQPRFRRSALPRRAPRDRPTSSIRHCRKCRVALLKSAFVVLIRSLPRGVARLPGARNGARLNGRRTLSGAARTHVAQMEDMAMALRDLIPWNGNRGREVTVSRGESNPFLTLHREMNRLFDDAFRSFDLAPFGSDRLFDRAMGWPNIEVSETEKEVKVTAELAGLDEKDVAIELAHGVLAIRGEKKTETEDTERRFSERFYGRFERQIPVDDVDEEKVSASFKNGVLTVTLPKSPAAQQKVRRIAINGK
jgi:HSP20 family protein